MDCLEVGELVVVEVGRVEKATWVIAHQEGAEIRFSAECAVNSTAGVFCDATTALDENGVVSGRLGQDNVALIGVIPVTKTGTNFGRRVDVALATEEETSNNWLSTLPGPTSVAVGLTSLVFGLYSQHRSSAGDASGALAPPAAGTADHEAQLKKADPSFLEAHALDVPMATPAFLEAHALDIPTATPKFLEEHKFDVPTHPPP